MKCPGCGGKMVKRECDKYDEQLCKFVRVSYWVCIVCGHIVYW